VRRSPDPRLARLLQRELVGYGPATTRSTSSSILWAPPQPLASTISIYAVIDDPDAHHGKARAAGARVVRELEDTPYGSREYSARDLEGNLWSFGTYDRYATG
jgi:uncharacterized glyoxalase superfamily protein PhnB